MDQKQVELVKAPNWSLAEKLSDKSGAHSPTVVAAKQVVPAERRVEKAQWPWESLGIENHFVLGYLPDFVGHQPRGDHQIVEAKRVA
ncbi:hypothetical protein [Thermogutta sp.]|uniref:hypothetical protein n=1 Tax=Thermogutta sp. TaxID=1962930 RepID=UPI00321FE909